MMPLISGDHYGRGPLRLMIDMFVYFATGNPGS
jgi:hypothetical protein